MKNLWQDLDTLTSDLNNPIDLVKTQSDYLEDGTGNLFYIDIEAFRKPGAISRTAIDNAGIKNDFMYKMSLSSAYLEEYKFNIFNIYYGITFYPLLVNVPREIGEEIIENCECIQVETNSKNKMYLLVSSEGEFEQLLETVFNCEKVRMVLKNMKTIIGGEVQEE